MFVPQDLVTPQRRNNCLVFAAHLVSAVLFPFILLAQPPDIRFEHISTEHGLSHSSVTGIIQDRRGFIWVSTGDGLNRYDGYSCRVFRHDPADTTSLSVNWTSSILEDENGIIWLGTNGGGLVRFDPSTEKFEQFRHDSTDAHSLSTDFVTVEFEDHEGMLWLATQNGLNVFDRKTGKTVHYFHETADPHSISSNWVTCLTLMRDGAVWAGTIDALNVFEPATKTFTRFLPDPKSHRSLSSGNINAIYEDRSGTVWIATYGGGLDRLNRATGTFRHYRHHSSNPNSLANDIVYTIFEDDAGYLWLGTRDGLDVFDKNTETFHHFRNEPKNPTSLSNNNVSAIYRDRSGTIWVGTYGGGINKVITERKKFKHYKNIPGDRNSLSNDFVFPIVEDRHGFIWIGTLGGGLTKFDRARQQFTHYINKTGDQFSISHNDVRAICEDSTGVLWIGTHGGGLNRFNPRTQRFTRFRHSVSSATSLSNDFILSLSLDKGGALWIGTAEAGLEKFDPSTGVFTHHPHDPSNLNSISDMRINLIYRDRSGILWVGTHDGGLDRFDPTTSKVTSFKNEPSNPHSLSNNDVRSVYEDASGTLWVGTFGGGLNKFSRTAQHFVHVSETDGLPSNEVYGILEDEQGHLWVSTNKGIARYDPRANLFRNYTVADGLQSDEFNSNSCTRTRDGTMLFGGVNGFNVFHPLELKDNPHVPAVVLTDFKVFGKPVKLDTAISEIRHITLQYWEDLISFEFAALDYIDPLRNRYAHKLDGFDREWIDNGTRRYINYTHLDPGEYVLRVKGSNNDGVWNDVGCSVRITIEPPFWQRWWFGTLVVVLFIVSVGGVVRYVSTRKLQRQVRQLEKQRALQCERDRISRDLHDHVGAQLANVITGLNIVRKYTKTVDSKTKRLLNSLEIDARLMMSQLRETIWALNSSAMELTKFTAELERYAKSQLKYHRMTKIHFAAQVDASHTLSPAHALNLFRIAQEALTNSFRHAKAKNISISLSVTSSKYLLLTIFDDGKGFEKTACDEQMGHGLANMEQRTADLGGVFRCESAPSHGTTIEVQIPLLDDKNNNA